MIETIGTIVSILIGAAMGYLGARLQMRGLQASDRDNLARQLTELQLANKDSEGYTPLSHWIVIRSLIERHGLKAGFGSPKDLRDSVEQEYQSLCEVGKARRALHLAEELQHTIDFVDQSDSRVAPNSQIDKGGDNRSRAKKRIQRARGASSKRARKRSRPRGPCR